MVTTWEASSAIFIKVRSHCTTGPNSTVVASKCAVLNDCLVLRIDNCWCGAFCDSLPFSVCTSVTFTYYTSQLMKENNFLYPMIYSML